MPPRAPVRSSVGVGLRTPHVDDILATTPAIDWFEIVAENYMVEGGRALRVLDAIRERYPVIAHGVGLYVGGAQGVDRAHLARLTTLARRARSPWVSDHLCWGSVDGTTSHDLLPLPYTPAMARRCAAQIRIVQGELEVPFAIENVSSYAELRASTMTEWAFVREVAELADCQILLDVNNVYVSAMNHGFEPRVYLDAIPPARVAQIHLAGHAVQAGCIIDTHDAPVSDPVWALYVEALARCGPTPTLIEWDARLPRLDVLIAEARTAAGHLAALAEVARAG